MGLFNKSNSESITLFTEEVPTISKGNAVKVSMLDEENKLEIKMPFAKKGTPPVTLGFDQIVAIERLSDVQIKNIEKNKSVIGRAVVGGLLLGGIGATVGAISGTGTKTETKKEYNFYMVVNYKSSDGDIKAISFKETPSSTGVGKFIRSLKDKASIKDIEIPDRIEL